MSETTLIVPDLYRTNYAAASTEYSLAHRQASMGDADTLGVSEINFLIARSRYMTRNCAIASSAKDKYATKLGSIKVNCIKPDGNIHTLAQDLFDSWAENPMLDGFGNLDTWQVACNHERFDSGKALTRLHTVVSDHPIPLKLQGIPAEYWDINYTGMDNPSLNDNGLVTKYGITFQNTKPLAYHFFKEGYFSIKPLPIKDLWKREIIDANDIINCFERKNANQWIGVPLLSSCLLTIYALEDLCDATIKQQTNASGVSWIVSSEGSALLRTPVGSVHSVGNSASEDPNKKTIFRSSAGGVQYLATGEKMQQVQSTDIGNNLVPMIKSELELIAAALNMPYFELKGDTSGMDFSSIRAILIQWRNRIEFLYQMVIIPTQMKPLTDRFLSYAKLKYKVANVKCTYQLPRWYGVDDQGDAQADLLEVMNGFTPIQAIWAERGYSKEQIDSSLKMLKETGLWDYVMKNNNPAPAVTPVASPETPVA
jgi:capsid protein